MVEAIASWVVDLLLVVIKFVGALCVTVLLLTANVLLCVVLSVGDPSMLSKVF